MVWRSEKQIDYSNSYLLGIACRHSFTESIEILDVDTFLMELKINKFQLYIDKGNLWESSNKTRIFFLFSRVNVVLVKGISDQADTVWT